MTSFTGISADSLFLLAENRFQDSKSFYEEHKPAIWAGVVEPLRALVGDLAPTVLAIDQKIIVDPLKNGCVSRVRRDNRYTHDKSMYRENMWFAFLRDKHAWDYMLPAFFMDFSIRGAEWGLGFYSTTADIMRTLRGIAEQQPDRVTAAIRRAKRAGFEMTGQPYARRRSTEDTPVLLRPLYDCRNISFTRMEAADFVASSDLPQTLINGFKALAPMYEILMLAVEMNVQGDDGRG